MKISEEFCFKPKPVPTIKEVQGALKRYSENLQTALELNPAIPIFIDTNVLLDYYKISFSERKELLTFFERNRERIFITSQVQKEFLKHRINHIRSFQNSLDEFVNSFANIVQEIEQLSRGEIKGFNFFTSSNKILTNDYRELKDDLDFIRKSLHNSLTSIFEVSPLIPEVNEKMKRIEEIRTELRGKADMEREDPLLNILAELNFTDELTSEEIEFTKVHYEQLKIEYNEYKSNQKEFFKYTFPGSGDKKDDSTGDLIIYHEIIKYMKEKEADAIFLTNDTEKNDWLLRQQADLIPFTHYIISVFQNTTRSLFIFQARDKIRLTYSPIYTEQVNLDEEESQEVLEENQEPDANQENTLDSEASEEQDTKLKILGKIDLSKIAKTQTFEPRKIEYEYNDITESEFLHELKASQEWADNYGNGFVGLRSFILNYLGNKGYNYRRAYRISEILEQKGKIEKYTHHAKNSNYNDVLAVRIVDFPKAAPN